MSDRCCGWAAPVPMTCRADRTARPGRWRVTRTTARNMHLTTGAGGLGTVPGLLEVGGHGVGRASVGAERGEHRRVVPRIVAGALGRARSCRRSGSSLAGSRRRDSRRWSCGRSRRRRCPARQITRRRPFTISVADLVGHRDLRDELRRRRAVPRQDRAWERSAIAGLWASGTPGW